MYNREFALLTSCLFWLRFPQARCASLRIAVFCIPEGSLRDPLGIPYGADHLEAATFVQRPNWFDLDQKIKINSKNFFRGVESFKSSKNKLCRCQNDGKLTITQLFLTKLLLM